MDDAFTQAFEAIYPILPEAVASANKLEGLAPGDDAIAVRKVLEDLCSQLTSIGTLLDGEADGRSEGLFKRALRWSGLVRASTEGLTDSERAQMCERILKEEEKTLAKLGVPEARTEAMLDRMRKVVASSQLASWGEAELNQISSDIKELRQFICTGHDERLQTHSLVAIVDGVHGVVKIVADLGKFAGDPTLILALCGVYSVVIGGKMVSGSVTRLRQIREVEDKLLEEQRESDENKQREARTTAWDAWKEAFRQKARRIKVTFSGPKRGETDRQ